LENERTVARRESYAIEIIKADIAKPLPFGDRAFDLIVHPVSNCYVEDVYHVWNECFRILKPGGILIAGMDNGFQYLFDDESSDPLKVVNKLPYNPLNQGRLHPYRPVRGPGRGRHGRAAGLYAPVPGDQGG
jgi:SAM-dependent methyltransferase